MRKVNEWRETDNGAMIHINEWVLTRWSEKVVYVLGILWLVLFAIGFIVGFAESIN